MPSLQRLMIRNCWGCCACCHSRYLRKMPLLYLLRWCLIFIVIILNSRLRYWTISLMVGSYWPGRRRVFTLQLTSWVTLSWARKCRTGRVLWIRTWRTLLRTLFQCSPLSSFWVESCRRTVDIVWIIDEYVQGLWLRCWARDLISVITPCLDSADCICSRCFGMFSVIRAVDRFGIINRNYWTFCSWFYLILHHGMVISRNMSRMKLISSSIYTTIWKPNWIVITIQAMDTFAA